uniref:Endonuclease/exonuclease/phosphatase domain-containing protein n=1 Tax=Cacopsylla melanoneura TaxID=428564 RepID=A0A8D8M312_9HEMI
MDSRVNQYLKSIRDNKIDFATYSDFPDFLHRKGLGSENLNVIHVNVRSINKHWLSLLLHLNDILHLLDVIVLTEINITDEECHCFQIDKFQQFSRCRASGNGGGILVYVRDTFQVDRLFFDLDQCEHLCLKLNHVKYKVGQTKKISFRIAARSYITSGSILGISRINGLLRYQTEWKTFENLVNQIHG